MKLHNAEVLQAPRVANKLTASRICADYMFNSIIRKNTNVNNSVLLNIIPKPTQPSKFCS